MQINQGQQPAYNLPNYQSPRRSALELITWQKFVRLLNLRANSDSDDEVKIIIVRDEGSAAKCVPVLVQGVSAYGIVDTAADIAIIGGRLFHKVASVA